MFRQALDALTALSVDGITQYGIDSLPATMARGNLPALLVLPLDIDGLTKRGLFTQQGDGFRTVAFSDGLKTVSAEVTHLLLAAPTVEGRGLRDTLPDLIDHIDDYFGALAAALTLNGALLEPAHVRIEPGVFEYGGVSYIGCAFRHTWHLAV